MDPQAIINRITHIRRTTEENILLLKEQKDLEQKLKDLEQKQKKREKFQKEFEQDHKTVEQQLELKQKELEQLQKELEQDQDVEQKQKKLELEQKQLEQEQEDIEQLQKELEKDQKKHEQEQKQLQRTIDRLKFEIEANATAIQLGTEQMTMQLADFQRKPDCVKLEVEITTVSQMNAIVEIKTLFGFEGEILVLTNADKEDKEVIRNLGHQHTIPVNVEYEVIDPPPSPPPSLLYRVRDTHLMRKD